VIVVVVVVVVVDLDGDSNVDVSAGPLTTTRGDNLDDQVHVAVAVDVRDQVDDDADDSPQLRRPVILTFEAACPRVAWRPLPPPLPPLRGGERGSHAEHEELV
jgi:hypothetical protein